MSSDINSLPASSPIAVPVPINGGGDTAAVPAAHPDSPSPSPRSASLSLQAAATMNAGLQREPSRRTSSGSLSRQRQSPQTGRRRSAVLMNLQLNDPALPAPGEMVSDPGFQTQQIPTPQSMPSASPLLVGRDPCHNRAPSLGELHRELEAEQEGQVNRLLLMIRQQQQQLQQLQAAQAQRDQSGQGGQAQSGLPSEDQQRSASIAYPAGLGTISSGSVVRSPSVTSHPRSSFDLSRDVLHRRSRTPSRGPASPRIRSGSISQEAEPYFTGVRDEAAYYQAETQSLSRENQMLRHRIRELERQLSEAHGNSAVTREPVHPSQLTHSTSLSEDDMTAVAPSRTISQPAATADVKDE
ncbi:hypothetical protein F5Y17DRAFT_474011 [Xylariaceae sp. FL0594]|nr:hypothetical protein F5Y17DRAFT_474011 [Xylariaceae sp. FL0594]